MTKIVLGKRPESFKRVVKFKMLDGSDAKIECEFKYRTKREFGEFHDSMAARQAERTEQAMRERMATIEAAPEGEDAPVVLPNVMTSVMTSAVEANAEYLAEILVGWNLDAPLSLESLIDLADELPAAVTAIADEYRAAVAEGRLGN